MGKDLNADYSNINEVVLDTLFLENNKLEVLVATDSVKTYKGFFYEFEIGDRNTKNNLASIREKKTYFCENPFPIPDK